MTKSSLVVDVSGKSGSNGSNGNSGSSGSHGVRGNSGRSGGASQRGGNGSNGGRGGKGTSGGHGGSGTNGQHAQNVKVTIDGLDHKSISVKGSTNENLCLDDGSVRALVFIANGGNGGDGGNGGRGGEGGDGGSGGEGGRGGSGTMGRRGCSGGPGGCGGVSSLILDVEYQCLNSGGNGGDGGEGGDGGNGASGGNGGNGGSITIETYNPSLLKFIHTECKKGKKGEGGSGGSGGRAGSGGIGGSGGDGGSGGAPGGSTGQGNTCSWGHRGERGRGGVYGNSGNDGRSGSSGRDGQNGVDGSVQFIVYDPITNQVLDRGNSVFDLVVDSFQMTALDDDGIYEPGEAVVISDVTITNKGGMILPIGSVISFPTTFGQQSFVSSGHFYILQQALRPGETFVVPFQFYGSISDTPKPTPNMVGHYKTIMPIQSLVTLLTSPFDNFLKNDYTVQYPVMLESIIAPTQLGRTERGTVTLNFRNISQINYGYDAKTHLRYSLVFDPRFIVHNEPNLNGVNGIEEELPMIPPGMTYSRTFQLEINDLAQFFEIVPFRASLFLRGKKIENAESVIRLTPNFTPITNPSQNPFDLLLFTDKHIQRPEFLCYAKIFEGLGLSINIWDIERYGSASFIRGTITRHPDSWVTGGFEGKMIILPMFGQGDDQHLESSDIIQLLRGTNWKDDNTSPTNGSLLFIGNVDDVRFRNRIFAPVPEKEIPESDLKEMFLLNSPNDGHLSKKVHEYIQKNCQKKAKSRVYVPYNVRYNPKKGGALSKTVLGTASLKELPITVSDNLFFVPTLSGNSQNFLIVDGQDNLNSTQFKANSNFGRLFYSVVMALPLEKKLKLLRQPTEWLKTVTFVEETGRIVTYVEAIILSLNYNMFMEIIYKEEIGRYTNIILKDFESNITEYKNNPNSQAIAESLYFVITKLRKDLKWKGMLLSKIKSGKQAFSKFCKPFQKILFSLLDSAQIDSLKKETKEKIKNIGKQSFIANLSFIQRPIIDEYHQELENQLTKNVFNTAQKSLAKNFTFVSQEAKKVGTDLLHDSFNY